MVLFRNRIFNFFSWQIQYVKQYRNSHWNVFTYTFDSNAVYPFRVWLIMVRPIIWMINFWPNRDLKRIRDCFKMDYKKAVPFTHHAFSIWMISKEVIDLFDFIHRGVSLTLYCRSACSLISTKKVSNHEMKEFQNWISVCYQDRFSDFPFSFLISKPWMEFLQFNTNPDFRVGPCDKVSRPQQNARTTWIFSQKRESRHAVAQKNSTPAVLRLPDKDHQMDTVTV